MSDGDFYSCVVCDEVFVVVDVVDARGLRLEFVRASLFNRERIEIVWVWVVLFFCGDDFCGVWGVFENVVFVVYFIVFNVVDFITNRDESVVESIEFRFGFGFGRFNY